MVVRFTFCSAEAKKIPEEYKEIRYNLCSIDFDPSAGTFGSRIDTLVNAEAFGEKRIFFPALPMTANILCSPYPITETFRSGIKRRIYGYWT